MVRVLKVQLEELQNEIDEREYEKGEMGEVLEKMKKSFKDKDALKDNGEFEVFKGKTYTNRSGRLQAAKGPEKEKLRQEVTPSMRANLIRIIGRYHSHVLPARGGADASTAAATD